MIEKIIDQIRYDFIKNNPKRVQAARIDFEFGKESESTTAIFFYKFNPPFRLEYEYPVFTRTYDCSDSFSFAQARHNLEVAGWSVREWSTLLQHGARAWRAAEPWPIRDRYSIQNLRTRLTTSGESPQRYALDLRFDYIGA